MDTVTVLPKGIIGKGFIPAAYIPKGKNEYYLRNLQCPFPRSQWRNLRPDEIELLTKHNNTASNWHDVLVTAEFKANLVRNSDFFGLVRIGALREAILEHHDLKLPAGIVNSRIISCDIGDDVAVHNVRYLAHYIIGSRCILSNIDEMLTTSHAKFGNGIVKDGEGESERIWLDIMNENGGRRILPFEGIISADAYLWAKYRDDKRLQKKLIDITQRQFDARRGLYSTVGAQCVIKNTRIIKNVSIGDHCCISGANTIKNISIASTVGEPTYIGEGVELTNGIIGRGCHIRSGCTAVGFVLGSNSNLTCGARLINSFVGDNSTISCCEVLNNLIFPAHEQHHNNSFLIASLIMGQSNLAAGATIGSNHNSRSNDGEVQAGRGFWPGLCTSVKHSSRFASFVLLAKGDFPAELDIPLPFSLVNNNAAKDRLEIMPAYWWRFNMYALARNSWKFRSRDQRKLKIQNIEFDWLAPDTVEEIIAARTLLEQWAALPEIHGAGLEKSKRPTLIIQAAEGYAAYGDMLHYYAVKNLISYMTANKKTTFVHLAKALGGERERDWTNLGGQLVRTTDVDQLRVDIGSGRLKTWEDIHGRYNKLWEAYPIEKCKHAYAVLCGLLNCKTLTQKHWQSALDRAVEIQEFVCEQVYVSRKKDEDNPFRQATYRNKSEMIAVTGSVEDNDFVKLVREETEEFKRMVRMVKIRK